MNKMNREEVEQEEMKKRLKENLRERERERCPRKVTEIEDQTQAGRWGGGGRTPGWSESITKMKRKKDGDKITSKIHVCL